MMPQWVDRLQKLPPPAHHPALATAKYPPTNLEDVYARGQYGITDLKLPKPAHAAILALLRQGSDGPEVLLTVRSPKMRRHGGEVALPGGKRDLDDSGAKFTRTLGNRVPASRWTVDVTTALREANEEVGLDSDSVEILAELPRCIALGGILTTPVVAWVREGCELGEPILSPDEVSSSFWMPLRCFLQAEHHQHKDILQGTVRMHAFEAHPAGEPVKVFGLTANVLIRVAQLALGKAPEFQMFVPPAAKL